MRRDFSGICRFLSGRTFSSLALPMSFHSRIPAKRQQEIRGIPCVCLCQYCRFGQLPGMTSSQRHGTVRLQENKGTTFTSGNWCLTLDKFASSRRKYSSMNGTEASTSFSWTAPSVEEMCRAFNEQPPLPIADLQRMIISLRTQSHWVLAILAIIQSATLNHSTKLQLADSALWCFVLDAESFDWNSVFVLVEKKGEPMSFLAELSAYPSFVQLCIANLDDSSGAIHLRAIASLLVTCPGQQPGVALALGRQRETLMHLIPGHFQPNLFHLIRFYPGPMTKAVLARTPLFFGNLPPVKPNQFPEECLDVDHDVMRACYDVMADLVEEEYTGNPFLILECLNYMRAFRFCHRRLLRNLITLGMRLLPKAHGNETIWLATLCHTCAFFGVDAPDLLKLVQSTDLSQPTYDHVEELIVLNWSMWVLTGEPVLNTVQPLARIIEERYAYEETEGDHFATAHPEHLLQLLPCLLASLDLSTADQRKQNFWRDFQVWLYDLVKRRHKSLLAAAMQVSSSVLFSFGVSPPPSAIFPNPGGPVSFCAMRSERCLAPIPWAEFESIIPTNVKLGNACAMGGNESNSDATHGKTPSPTSPFLPIAKAATQNARLLAGHRLVCLLVVDPAHLTDKNELLGLARVQKRLLEEQHWLVTCVSRLHLAAVVQSSGVAVAMEMCKRTMIDAKPASDYR